MKMSRFCWVASLILFTLEGFSPLSAQADDWFYLTAAENDTMHFFVDQTSISRVGRLASMRSMVVYQQINEDGVVALIQLDELDCDRNQWRLAELTYLYDDQSVRQDTDSASNEWQPAGPQSIGELKIEIACGSN